MKKNLRLEAIKTIKDTCKEHGSCGDCPFYDKDSLINDCLFDDSPAVWNMREIEEAISNG